MARVTVSGITMTVPDKEVDRYIQAGWKLVSKGPVPKEPGTNKELSDKRIEASNERADKKAEAKKTERAEIKKAEKAEEKAAKAFDEADGAEVKRDVWPGFRDDKKD